MDIVATPAKRGRPPGTPSLEDMQKKELIRGIKFYARVLDDLERDYDKLCAGMTPVERMAFAEFLARRTEAAIKLWVAPAKEGAKPDEEVDAEKILKSIFEGTK